MKANVVCSTVTITNLKWRIRNHAYGKLTIDEKDAKILKYLQQLIAENYEPKTVIENDETDTETNITDQSHENEKEEGHDIDDLIFIDDDTDKEEE